MAAKRQQSLQSIILITMSKKRKSKWSNSVPPSYPMFVSKKWDYFFLIIAFYCGVGCVLLALSWKRYMCRREPNLERQLVRFVRYYMPVNLQYLRQRWRRIILGSVARVGGGPPRLVIAAGLCESTGIIWQHKQDNLEGVSSNSHIFIFFLICPFQLAFIVLIIMYRPILWLEDLNNR